MRTRALVLAVLCVLLTGAVVHAADDATERARHLVKKGMRQLAANHLERSQKLLAEAARLDPSLPEAIDGLSHVAARLGDWKGAADGLAVAEQLYRQRAVNRLEKQQDATLKLQETQKAFWDLYAYLDGAACMAENDWRRFEPGKDITTPAHIEGFSPDGLPAGLCFRRAVALLHLDRVAEAREELQRELAASPKSGAVHVNLAVCAMRLGEPDEAIRELDEGVRLGADEPQGLRAEITAALPPGPKR